MSDRLTHLKNYRRISARLVTAGQPTVEQFDAIAASGIEVVINLGLLETDYALPNEQQLTESQGLVYEHIPVEWQAPELTDVQQFLDCMEKHRERTVLIHCAANKRVSCFIALYQILVQQRPRAQALQDISMIWQPNATWQSFIDSTLSVLSNPKN